MKKFLIILSFLFILPSFCHAEPDINKLAKGIKSIYPLWKINGKITEEEYGFELLFDVNNPQKIEIPDFETILNGQSYTLLSCYGKFLSDSKNGYIVGTAGEGPTFGTILLFNEKMQKISSIGCQKVVKINLVNLLNNDRNQIITWEDHHYGTNTTRRVLNIYQTDMENNLNLIFSHDLVDSTYIPEDKEIYYSIDYQSLAVEKKIKITRKDTNQVNFCTWNGHIYEGRDCQQVHLQ
jgi:hypothetical protein